MNAARRISMTLIAAALCIGLVAAPALGGKKRKTTITFNSGSPSLSGSKNVKARGSLRSTTACLPLRGMKLFLTDATGGVLATLDSKSSDSNGNWSLQGTLPSSIPSNTPFYVQVKATKRVAGKSVCRAGLSPVVQLTSK